MRQLSEQKFQSQSPARCQGPQDSYLLGLQLKEWEQDALFAQYELEQTRM